MTDTATTEPNQPTSRRRLLIVLAAVLVVVIALIVGSFLYAASAANGKASDYDDAYAAWKAKDKAVLLAATAKLPVDTYLRKDTSSAKGLAKQKKGCDAVAAAREDLADAARRLPTMGDSGFMAKVSSKYSDAGDRSERRAKLVATYVSTASKTLAQVERDCRWNIAYNTSAVKPNKLWKDTEKYLMKGTGSEPGVTCSEKVCISSITKKKNKYADLRIRALKEQRKTLALLKSKDCEATSYGRACVTLAKSYASTVRTSLASYTFIRKTASTVGNNGIDKRQAKERKAWKAAVKADRAAVLKVAPELKKSKDLKASPSWTDIFFAHVDKRLLAGLKDERAAIGKL
ncbi:hypothetical protein ASE12_18185 [Aeromicrobium sp. Root236]|uniref:hypothetical protein n=1 Tax=Aeromicrobium sp. Root236 TaxID=1736498 RepID=UPI0006F1D432|nr:hypothetical protein [Aeromicrobium sp. Root236]KRC66528.1 hypothetical protein ASE12_18185 [Aeromicrobium sp. Root236]